ncbi:hypothetical protein CWI39_0742p0030 [Hamiltosporidium magnivora]|uniref:Uncharacterized protein n=1 Tax=Hamiltosporidium magnivora TaxID=148818 RepID=A0A4V2JVP6_9MICR|nr:hypothetical protein CWI39_0742p0030 [Hamiltosporidium magnivora]
MKDRIRKSLLPQTNNDYIDEEYLIGRINEHLMIPNTFYRKTLLITTKRYNFKGCPLDAEKSNKTSEISLKSKETVGFSYEGKIFQNKAAIMEFSISEDISFCQIYQKIKELGYTNVPDIQNLTLFKNIEPPFFSSRNYVYLEKNNSFLKNYDKENWFKENNLNSFNHQYQSNEVNYFKNKDQNYEDSTKRILKFFDWNTPLRLAGLYIYSEILCVDKNFMLKFRFERINGSFDIKKNFVFYKLPSKKLVCRICERNLADIKVLDDPILPENQKIICKNCFEAIYVDNNGDLRYPDIIISKIE